MANADLWGKPDTENSLYRRLTFVLTALTLSFGSLTVRAVETWYVDDALGKDDGTYDGKSEETPFKTIGKALASTTPTDATQTTSPAGDTIWIADGTYLIEETLTTENSCRILSLSGDRTKVIVDAQGKCPCLRLPTTGPNDNHSRTWKICGITFRNGFSDKWDSWEYNNGDWSYSAAGLGLGCAAMVSNCVVESCHRVVSGEDTSSNWRYLVGGGIAMRGYPYRWSVGKSFSREWSDVNPGIYDTVVTNCSLFARMTRSNNKIASQGGGVWCSYSVVSNVLVAGCSVSNACIGVNGSSQSLGGGIYAHTGSRIVDCTICQCLSARVPGTTGWDVDGYFGTGGGVAFNGAQTADSLTYDTDTIRGCLIEGNVVIGAAGGGLYADGIRVENCTIRTNHLIAVRKDTSYRGGTGAKLTGNGVSMKGCLIEGNDAPDLFGFSCGGALEIMSSVRARVTDTVVRNNTGAHRGGLSLAYDTTATVVSNVVVVGNVSTNQDCALFCSSSKSLLLVDSIFTGNRGGTMSASNPNYAGVVALGSSNSTYSNIVIRNTLFLKNETTGNLAWLIGGSFSATRAAGWQPLTIENCSFVGNSNRTGWGLMQAIYFGGDDTRDLVRIKGCVFANNGYGSSSQPNKAGFSPNVAAGDISYSYCDAKSQNPCTPIPVTDENHNMDGGDSAVVKVDPKFVDAENGDYRLQKDSPLVDAGGPFASWMGTGSRRSVQDIGNGGYAIAPVGKWGVAVSRTETQPRRSGEAVDMGCFEYYFPKGLMLLFR